MLLGELQPQEVSYEVTLEVKPSVSGQDWNLRHWFCETVISVPAHLAIELFFSFDKAFSFQWILHLETLLHKIWWAGPDRDVQQSWFSYSTLMQVPGIKLRWLRFYGKHLYWLNHLAGCLFFLCKQLFSTFCYMWPSLIIIIHMFSGSLVLREWMGTWPKWPNIASHG